MGPRVSVVIPAYNAASTIGQTLDSVFSQTFRDFEVVVVNEAKPAATRNIGVRAARGELVAFLDADDWWREDKLERQVAVFDGRPDVGLVYTADATVDSAGKVLSVNPCPAEARGRIYELLTVRNAMVGSSVMARREAIARAGGFDESLTSIENWALWIRISRDWAIEYIDEPLTLYRVHEGNRSSNVELRRRNVFQVLAKYHDPRDRSPQARQRRLDAYFHVYFNVLGKAYFSQHEMGAARRVLLRALWLRPDPHVLRLFCLSLLGKRGYVAVRALKRRLSGAA